MQDLIVLCADLGMKLGVEALLGRPQDLGFRTIDFQVEKHPNRDNGVLQEAHGFLRPQCNRFSYAIAMCDFDGCGKESKLTRENIEASIEQRLRSNGWNNRATAIVIKPELEAWVWVDWRALAEQAGWPGGEASLRNWLMGEGLIKEHQSKPDDPKESLERVLKQTTKGRSASLFSALGGKADIKSCKDPSFKKLVSQLKQWFPPR
jgi:hypothetical protein